MDSDNIFGELNPSDSNPERLTKGKEIRKKHLINKLNYINFQDGTVLVNFKHIKYNTLFPTGPNRNHVLERS